MGGEFNFNPNNIKVTFTPDTNNIATSDELKVAGVFTDSKNRSYTYKKRIVKGVAAVGIGLVSISGIMQGKGLISNNLIKDPPEITSHNIVLLEGTDTLSYEFTVINKTNNYNVIFLVNVNGIEKFKLDVSIPDTYKGEVKDLGYNNTINYSLTFNNKLDYEKTLLSGEFKS